MIVRSRAPLRLGLAGGGTDVSPFCDQHGGFVMNVTINKYAYATIDASPDGNVCFHALDADLMQCVKPEEADLAPGPLQLMKGVYRRITMQYLDGRAPAIRVRASSDAPPGSGLGSSSTMVVALVTAFAEYFDLPLGEYEIAHLAYDIERKDLGLSGGKQDQYAASFGGFNFMEFYADNRVIVNPLRVKNWIICELEASLVLFYTGVSRESANIIADQSAGVKQGTLQAIDAMHAIKREALTMKECLLKGDFAGIVDSMREGWENKKRSARSVSNPLIDEIYSAACDAGALAGKISGAGGGGFMMFFVPPERRMAVIRGLARFQGQVSNCHFTKHGTQAWRV